MLSECFILEYSNPCTACPTQCLKGCRRNETCSLCKDPLCQKCKYEDTCIECYAFANKRN